MSAVASSKMSLEEYLATEPDSEFKREFVNGEVIVMVGASYAHNVIASNLIALLHGSLRSGPCKALGSDLRVHIDETGLYAYPDISVVCEQPRFVQKVRPDTLLNPIALIEILSESTESWDRGAKFAHYRRLDSLQEFWLVSQFEARIEQYIRGEEAHWILTDVIGLEAGVAPSFSKIEPIPMREVYSGVPGVDPETAG